MVVRMASMVCRHTPRSRVSLCVCHRRIRKFWFLQNFQWQRWGKLCSVLSMKSTRDLYYCNEVTIKTIHIYSDVNTFLDKKYYQYFRLFQIKISNQRTVVCYILNPVWICWTAPSITLSLWLYDLIKSSNYEDNANKMSSYNIQISQFYSSNALWPKPDLHRWINPASYAIQLPTCHDYHFTSAIKHACVANSTAPAHHHEAKST